jgi:hypothetical protein
MGRLPSMGEEREVQRDPEVLIGDDELPRQPAPPLDPYTPEPGPRPGDRRAFKVLWLAWIPLLVGLGFLIWAVVR